MARMNETPSISAIVGSVEDHQEWLKVNLRRLVEIESPSDSPAGVNCANDFVADLAAAIGAQIKRHKQKEFGDVLELRFGPLRSKRKPVMLLGHLDTVWPMGTLKSMPWREADGRLWGPGVLDMKAGVMMALAALKSLKELGTTQPATMLLNSDEEVGSTVSRPITERLALAASGVFVLEPAQGLAYKTARKGVGQYELHVTGVAAHSGVDFLKGHSAVREMAHLIETVSGFTDLKRGRTVNCGVVRGGTRSNVIAEHAYAEVDVRTAKASDAARVDKLFRLLKVTDKACRLEVTGGSNRPPMERTAGTVALFRKARRIAAEMGLALDEASTGGGSDGNFTSALGVPTLDGMGAVGEGAHAADESVVVEHLVPRTAMISAMIAAS
jgi:glutamate carboxypeptidase